MMYTGFSTYVPLAAILLLVSSIPGCLNPSMDSDSEYNIRWGLDWQSDEGHEKITAFSEAASEQLDRVVARFTKNKGCDNHDLTLDLENPRLGLHDIQYFCRTDLGTSKFPDDHNNDFFEMLNATIGEYDSLIQRVKDLPASDHEGFSQFLSHFAFLSVLMVSQITGAKLSYTGNSAYKVQDEHSAFHNIESAYYRIENMNLFLDAILAEDLTCNPDYGPALKALEEQINYLDQIMESPHFTLSWPPGVSRLNATTLPVATIILEHEIGLAADVSQFGLKNRVEYFSIYNELEEGREVVLPTAAQGHQLLNHTLFTTDRIGVQEYIDWTTQILPEYWEERLSMPISVLSIHRMDRAMTVEFC